jgi:UDP-N-acetylmuramoyl-L-alanyl-D-glutamate--2,6-diaminopimelate ligase
LGPADVSIAGLCYRSDQVASGSLFFCVPGFVRDGHDFAPDAVAKGAAALCVERPLGLSVPQVVVPSVRRAMGPVASVFHGHPSAHLMTVGITGTNGKTTSAFLAAHLLDRAGSRAGLMGTIERRVGGVSTPAARTTPEALDVQRDLAAMVEAGDKAAVMEVSSHALDLGRVLGIRFSVVAFTNLTQDHLDYHQTLDAYFEAKRLLFTDPVYTGDTGVAVINIDDPYGRRLAAEYPHERLLTFSTDADAVMNADLVMCDYAIDAAGTHGLLVTSKWGEHEVMSPLVGSFNVANTLTALGIGLGLGLDLRAMLTDLRGFTGVPGRMERVDAGQPFAVLVDYAHTPDSVRNVLLTARALTSGRLLAVLGCGGDRDRSKRPQMGCQAEALADKVFVTSDNPRSEDPEAIIADILSGMDEPCLAVVDADRRESIRAALSDARPGDVVLILGKGHESGQEFADRKVPFDDRLVARQLLDELRGAVG